MTSKTDKVGKILDNHDAQLIRILRIEPDVEKAIMQSDILLQAARHALLEVIKAELPERMDTPLTEAAGVEVDIENINYGYNQALTEVNAILERLFK